MLQRFSLKLRISLLILPLIIGLAITSGEMILQNYKTWQEGKGLKNNLDYFISISSVIHDLQRERGRNAQFLNGLIKKEELGGARDQTKESIKKVRALLEVVPLKIRNETIGLLQELTNIRSFVDSQEAQAAEAYKRMTGLIGQFIHAQVEAALYFRMDGIESTTVSFTTLEAAKENMGRLRGAVAAILGADKPIDMQTVSQLEAYKSGVLENLNSPGLLVSELTRQQITAVLKSVDWQWTIKSEAQIVKNSAIGNYGINPAEWFQKVSGAIDQTHSIMTAELGAISEKVSKIYKSAQISFWTLFIVICVVFVGITFFAWSLIREVTGKMESFGRELAESASSTVLASGELSATSGNLSTSASQQASAVQETVSSLDEIRTMVDRNAESAGAAHKSSQKMAEQANQGRAAIQEMVSSIDNIHETIEEMATQIETSNTQLSEIMRVISEISEKAEVINDIVLQTKLLSFNASVEAARAGDNGKGFSVVADEVGNLARMSGAAAGEITQLLSNSIETVDKIINESKTKIGALAITAKDRVVNGSSAAQQCTKIFDAIANNLKEMNQKVGEIALASQEQSEGINEISKAMNQLDQVTHLNSAAASEGQSHVKKLTEQAKNLDHISNGMRSLVQGSV